MVWIELEQNMSLWKRKNKNQKNEMSISRILMFGNNEQMCWIGAVAFQTESNHNQPETLPWILTIYQWFLVHQVWILNIFVGFDCVCVSFSLLIFIITFICSHHLHHSTTYYNLIYKLNLPTNLLFITAILPYAIPVSL